jgi:nitroreductase
MDERLWTIFARRSIRKYAGQPVSEADITGARLQAVGGKGEHGRLAIWRH